MTNNLVVKTLFGLSTLIIIFFFGYKFLKEEKKNSLEKKTIVEDIDTSSNIIKDVNYRSKDEKGNEYILYAKEGQIDFNNNKIIFLTNVKASISMNNGEIINIQSDYGKYNTNNYDTIFSKNILIVYADNKIKGNYVDFSFDKNLLIISKNVVFSSQKSLLNADVVEIDITTKDIKIFMYEKEKKVKIQSN